jgi:hypothetical protein
LNIFDLIPSSFRQQISTLCSILFSAIFTSDCHVSALGASVKKVTRFLKADRRNLNQFNIQAQLNKIRAFSPTQIKLKWQKICNLRTYIKGK